MAITLNKQAIRCEELAIACGKITPLSPPRSSCYDISRAWRDLHSLGSNYQSDILPEWSEREVAAADILMATLTYLQRIGCKDIERLLRDCMKRQEKGNR